MLRHPLRALVWPLGVALGACGPSGSDTARAAGRASTSPAAGGETYATTGVIKSFGPGRAYVNIAHDDIAGYMKAMTMSFEPRSASQIAAGDAVKFRFLATDDGRRVLESIEKR
ncbi:MAG: copper-binding protein [Polyangiaceae bacterium]|nr:copper-binding protein [Polyangiaceae bacterium]